MIQDLSHWRIHSSVVLLLLLILSLKNVKTRRSCFPIKRQKSISSRCVVAVLWLRIPLHVPQTHECRCPLIVPVVSLQWPAHTKYQDEALASQEPVPNSKTLPVTKVGRTSTIYLLLTQISCSHRTQNNRKLSCEVSVACRKKPCVRENRKQQTTSAM